MNLLEKLKIAFHIMCHNPKLFLKFLSYRLQKLSKKWRKSYNDRQLVYIGKAKFTIDFNRLGSNHYTKQMLFHCYELHLLEILKKFLEPGHTFIDVGANVGYISTFAASLVGESGKVIAFEPVPQIFAELKNIVALNPRHHIKLNNLAISEDGQPIRMNCTFISDCGGSTAVPGFHAAIAVKTKEQMLVNSVRLDSYLLDHQLDKVAFIKIDVEGYEFNVLKSLEQYFQNTPFRPVIFCELAPTALKLLGVSIEDVFVYMKQYGYQAFDSFACHLQLNSSNIQRTTDVLFRAVHNS